MASVPLPNQNSRLNNEDSESEGTSTSKMSSIFLRFYSSDGQRSTRLECDENTTCADICQHFSCDVITLQIGNYHFRQLKPETSPAVILHDFCRILAMSEDNVDNRNNNYIFSYADSPSFRHIFSFFLGRPRVRTKSSLNSGILSEEVLIRKGKIIHNWSNAKAVFYNSNIRLQTKQNQDEILQIRNMKVDIFDSKKGKALRLRSDDSSCYLLIFQRPNILQLWLSKAQQIEKSNQVDASDEHLTMIPEQILNNEARIQVLNLRRNSLLSRPPSEKSSTLLGYVDDIYRIHSLQVIDLSANQILNFPVQLTLLPQLRQLNLSSNYISEIPKEVGNMKRVQNLNFSNNLLDSVPDEIGFCGNLKILDLSFNQLSQVIHCERLQLTSLHLSGESLTHVFADNNLLDSIVVMPLPQNLQTLSLSYNHFKTLPDWVCDCQQLTFLRANNNQLDSLPERIFCSPSIRCIFAFNNSITRIPEDYDENALETFILYKNKICQLPKNFFGMCPRLRQLNLSSNLLELLPYFDGSVYCRMQILRLANNFLTEDSVPVIVNIKHLKVVDLSHNFFNSFDDSALLSLELLEEINLSSNRLSRLPDCFALLPSLQILRAHSNQLVYIPQFQNSSRLQTLDVSSNNISLGTLKFQTPPSLRHVDVTCNSGDFVTDTTAVVKMNKINISDSQQNLFGFQIGVSGSRGSKNKQCIRQLRVDNTFVFIDGGSNYYMSSSICRFLSNHLRENTNSDIRSILLRCHCELGEEGERLGASVMILRLNEKLLEISSTGTISAAISKNQKMRLLVNGRYEIDDDEYSRIREGHGFVDEENRINGIIGCSRQLGHFSMFPVILPTHCYKTVQLDDSVDGLVVANSAVWTMLSIDDVTEVFQNNRNPIVVAKKLQDKLQSFDYGGNSNILVMSRMKPAVTFTESNHHHYQSPHQTSSPSSISALAVPALIVEEPVAPHPQVRSSKSPMPRHHKSSAATSSYTSDDTPIFSLTYSHPRSPSLPPTPSPPPLPQSTPPTIEYERIHLNSTSSTSSNIDRYYSNLISKRSFNETRDMLDKSLKLTPPNTITFHI